MMAPAKGAVAAAGVSWTAAAALRLPIAEVPEGGLSLDDALSHVGFGRFQAGLMVTVGVGYCSDTVELIFVMFVNRAIAEEWGLTELQVWRTGHLGALVRAVV